MTIIQIILIFNMEILILNDYLMFFDNEDQKQHHQLHLKMEVLYEHKLLLFLDVNSSPIYSDLI